MAQDAELASCLDGLTGQRAAIREVYDWFELGEREGFVTHSSRVVAWMRECDARRYPLRCGGELLIQRFRTECFQLPDGPSWQGVSLEACPALGGEQSHSDSFGDLAELRCVWCCAQPFWPVQACCEWQANIRANGWLDESPSYRALFEAIERDNPHLCAQCPADWACPYHVCERFGRCIYPSADSSRCSLIVRGEP